MTLKNLGMIQLFHIFRILSEEIKGEQYHVFVNSFYSSLTFILKVLEKYY